MAAAAEAEAAKIRGGYIDAKAPAYLTHEARPLAEHLDDFKAMLLAKGGWPEPRPNVRDPSRRVIELAKARRISDLSLSKSPARLAGFEGRACGKRRINHHVRAVKAFSRWLWRDGPPENTISRIWPRATPKPTAAAAVAP